MTSLTPTEARAVYDRVGARQDTQGWYEDPATNLLLAHARLAEARAVFEMGCGTGRLAEAMLAAMPPDATYLGTDLSPVMVGLAEARLGADPRATLQLVDGGPPARAPHSCDRFVSAYVFDLLSGEDARRSVASAHAMLRPGGLLCLAGLAPGHTALSRIVAAGWRSVWRLRPSLVGGCRPVPLAPLVSGTPWEIVAHERVAPWGVPSEVLVARRT